MIFGEKKKKKIIGPEDWYHPETGEKIKVYKRTRKSKWSQNQLFTITNDGQCMEEFGIVDVVE